MLKVTGPRDRSAGRGQRRRKQQHHDKGDCGPTTEHDEARLMGRGGQGGGKGLLLGSQICQ